MMDTDFDDLLVLAEMTEAEASAKLAELETTKDIDDARGLFETPAWKYRQHAFGYLPTASESSKQHIAINPASNIAPDKTLQGVRIKITLDRMMIANYPGWGDHSVLFNFSAKNSAQNNVEQIHFNQLLLTR